jgi:hypothetical protein
MADYFHRLRGQLGSRWRMGLAFTFTGLVPTLLSWIARLGRDEMVVRGLERVQQTGVRAYVVALSSWALAHPITSGGAGLATWIAFCAWLSTTDAGHLPLLLFRPRPFAIDISTLGISGGVELLLTNTTPAPIQRVTVNLADLTRWMPDHKRFVMTAYTHAAGPFAKIQLHPRLPGDSLFPGSGSLIPFISPIGTMLSIKGTSADGVSRDYQISCASGVYRATLEIQSSRGTDTRYFCFRTEYARVAPLFFSDNDTIGPRNDELAIPPPVQATPKHPIRR